MKVIYHCYGGTHTSIVAASLHVGKLTLEENISVDDILKLDLFDSLKACDRGKINFFGRDERGVEIYVCGMGTKARIVKRAIKDIIEVYGIDSQDIYFASTLPYVNLYIRLGGFLSRSLGTVNLGRFFLIRGIKKKLPEINKLVNEVKLEIDL